MLDAVLCATNLCVHRQKLREAEWERGRQSESPLVPGACHKLPKLLLHPLIHSVTGCLPLLLWLLYNCLSLCLCVLLSPSVCLSFVLSLRLFSFLSPGLALVFNVGKTCACHVAIFYFNFFSSSLPLPLSLFLCVFPDDFRGQSLCECVARAADIKINKTEREREREETLNDSFALDFCYKTCRKSCAKNISFFSLSFLSQFTFMQSLLLLLLLHSRLGVFFFIDIKSLSAALAALTLCSDFAQLAYPLLTNLPDLLFAQTDRQAGRADRHTHTHAHECVRE